MATVFLSLESSLCCWSPSDVFTAGQGTRQPAFTGITPSCPHERSQPAAFLSCPGCETEALPLARAEQWRKGTDVLLCGGVSYYRFILDPKYKPCVPCCILSRSVVCQVAWLSLLTNDSDLHCDLDLCGFKFWYQIPEQQLKPIAVPSQKAATLKSFSLQCLYTKPLCTESLQHPEEHFKDDKTNSGYPWRQQQ